jgi:hypothetical protein
MNNKQQTLKTVGVFLLSAVLSLTSCNKAEDPITGEVAQTAVNETTVSAQTNETDDMASNALTTADTPTGRVAATFTDDRFKCATLTFDSTSKKASGRVVIDFGTGCTDSHGNTRKGEIIITWSGGRWFDAGSTHVITFSGYSINNVQFSDNDIRTVHNISTANSPLTWTVEASHSLTWPDQSVATREVHETRQWIRTATIVDDKFIISQTAGAAHAATGTNRHSKAYTTDITTPLEYDRSCAISNKVFLPVKGVKVITVDNNKSITIDFGDGACDNTFIITISGHSVTVGAKNDSSAD